MAGSVDAPCGYIILHKLRGQSSMAALAGLKRFVRRRYGKVKLGHAGTLDPLASGVLPVAVGQATKTITIVQKATKTYRFTIRWGIATDSDDADGRVLETHDHRPTAQDIRAILPQFCGTQWQRPPDFCALHVHGQRAYRLARCGTAIKFEPREIHIHTLHLLTCPSVDEAVLRVQCSKGTYVRSLARDMAIALATKGHVQALTREAVGRYDLAQAHTLKAIAMSSKLPLCPLSDVLADLPHIVLTKQARSHVLQGQAVPCPALPMAQDETTQYFATADDAPLALGYVRAGKFFPTKLLCF